MIRIGLDQWKKEDKSPYYDWELIKTRLEQIREIRHSNKGQSAMIFALRTSLARNLGDMGNSKVKQFHIFFFNANICLFIFVPFFLCHIALLIFTCRNKEINIRLYRRGCQAAQLDM